MVPVLKNVDGHRDCWALDHLRLQSVLSELQLSKVLIIMLLITGGTCWTICLEIDVKKKMVMEGVL